MWLSSFFSCCKMMVFKTTEQNNWYYLGLQSKVLLGTANTKIVTRKYVNDLKDWQHVFFYECIVFIFGQVDYIWHKSFAVTAAAAALHVQVIPCICNSKRFLQFWGCCCSASSRARDQIPSLEHLMALFRGWNARTCRNYPLLTWS